MLDFTVEGSNDTRSGFGEGLLEAGKKNPKVVALCADLRLTENGCIHESVS